MGGPTAHWVYISQKRRVPWSDVQSSSVLTRSIERAKRSRALRRGGVADDQPRVGGGGDRALPVEESVRVVILIVTVCARRIYFQRIRLRVDYRLPTLVSLIF